MSAGFDTNGLRGGGGVGNLMGWGGRFRGAAIGGILCAPLGGTEGGGMEGSGTVGRVKSGLTRGGGGRLRSGVGIVGGPPNGGGPEVGWTLEGTPD